MKTARVLYERVRVSDRKMNNKQPVRVIRSDDVSGRV